MEDENIYASAMDDDAGSEKEKDVSPPSSPQRSASPNLHANQGREEEGQEPDLRDVRHATTVWQAAIEDFSPTWYSICMSTGILAIIMARFPYPFHGLPVLTDIMYLLNLTLFTLFTLIMMTRFILYPKAALRKTAGDFQEICFWAAPPIAWLTLAALTGTQVSNAYWGGHAFTLVAVVMWWFGAVWMVLTATAIFITMFRTGIVHDRSLTTAIFLPTVGLATAAAEAGVITNYSFDCSARLAVPMLITSYFIVGFAIFLAIVSYSIFLHRLMATGWPKPAQIPSMILLVGPMGQGSTALQLLGTAAHSKLDFSHYARGTFLVGSAASGLDSAGILFGMLLLGFDYFWLLVALFAIVEAACRRQLSSYSLMWWSTIFPLGTMNTSWLVLSVEMDSPAFRALTVGLFLILLIDWFINMAFTLYGTVAGSLFFTRTKEDLRKQLDDEKQD